MNTLVHQSDRRIDNIWRRLREELRAEMDPVRFQYWISPLRVVSADPERVVVACRTAFSRDQIASKFGKRIADLLAVSLPRLSGVDFIVDPEAPAASQAWPHGFRRASSATGGIAAGVSAAPRSSAPADAAPAVPLAAASPTEGARVLVEDVKRKVAAHFGIPISDLESASRKRAVVRPRQMAMLVARDLTGRSYPEIARRFGSRDHTTVIHGCEKIRRLSEADPEVAAEIEALKQSIRG